MYIHGLHSCIPRYILALPVSPEFPEGNCASARCAAVTSGPQQGAHEFERAVNDMPWDV